MNIQGNIEVHDVSFAYAKSSALIIKNASINFSAGKLYLLCGPSGSGKSTLLKLLMTQEIAPAGQIIFDGQDVRSLELDELRKNFGVIKQDSSVFSGSIRANILCGRDISHAHLEDLLLSHEIYDVILDLPMGLETYVFDNATNISRLQLVIILLARALVHKPKILFLDEIFKGLNLEQQAIMSKYLYDLNITRIIISHDIKNMSYDHIVTSKDWSN
jgi:ATP-binding cassette subfamily C protein